MDDCSSASAFDGIDFSVLGFDSVLRDVIDGTFRIDLPMSIQNSIPKHLQDPQHARGATGNPTPPFVPGTPSPNKKQRVEGNNPRIPARGTFEVNENVFPPWKLLPGEDYAETFVRGIDRTALPKISICLNYHVRGNCHTLCERVASHCPAQAMDEAIRKSVTSYIAAARLQKKNKKPHA